MQTQITNAVPELVSDMKLEELGLGKRSWFQYKRWAGGGPPWMKIGGKARYDLNEVINWLREQKRTSTSSNGTTR